MKHKVLCRLNLYDKIRLRKSVGQFVPKIMVVKAEKEIGVAGSFLSVPLPPFQIRIRKHELYWKKEEWMNSIIPGCNRLMGN